MLDSSISLVQNVNLIVMDRLQSRGHWKNPSTAVECHTCQRFFHYQGKEQCYMCGHIVCEDCIQAMVVQGTALTASGRVFDLTVPATACLACYFQSFQDYVYGYIDVVDFDTDDVPTSPHPSKMTNPSTVIECLVSKAPLRPITLSVPHVAPLWRS